jgi:hypothetical protein
MRSPASGASLAIVVPSGSVISAGPEPASGGTRR